MDTAIERRIVYVLCLVGLVIALVTLFAGLDQSNTQVIGVSLLLVAITIGTAIAAWRSGTVREEPDGDDAGEGDGA